MKSSTMSLPSTTNTINTYLLIPKAPFFKTLIFPSSLKTPVAQTRLKLVTPINILNHKKQQPPSLTSEFDEFDEDDEFFDDFDEEEEEEEDELMMPIGKMSKWLENKPRGFGEGKVYDTSIEDKLFEEITQSRIAQAININNLKKSPVPVKKQNLKKDTAATQVLQSGIRVRVSNLPKKKNIHRDLRSTFKEVRGVVNITPVVLGNKKTRDPVCKGFAFVDFKSEDDASRFVQQFSCQTLAFGRIQKQIKCEIINPSHSNHSDVKSDASFYSPASEGELDDELDVNGSTSEVTASEMSNDPDEELLQATLDNGEEDVGHFENLKLGGGDNAVPNSNSTRSPSAKKQRKKKKAKVTEKTPELNVPGSAKRLKIKEKAVLTDVLTKYGLASAVLSKQDN